MTNITNSQKLSDNILKNVAERFSYEESKDALTKEKKTTLERFEKVAHNEKIMSFLADTLEIENFNFINKKTSENKDTRTNIKLIEKCRKFLNAITLQDEDMLDKHTRAIIKQALYLSKTDVKHYSTQFVQAMQSAKVTDAKVTKLNKKYRAHYEASTTSTQTSSTMNMLCYFNLAHVLEEKSDRKKVYAIDTDNEVFDFMRED